MIVTVTPNPALDLTYHLDQLLVGDSQRVAPARVRAGGKGVNVARVLHAQQQRVRVLAPVGGATGATFRADLDAASLPHQLLDVEAATRSTLALVTPTSTTNLNETGTPLTRAEWDELVSMVGTALAAPAADDASARVLVCSGSMPPHTPADAVGRLVEAAHAAGAIAIVDTSGPHLVAAADAGADLLKPNEKELLTALRSIDDVRANARRLARRSGGVVVVSLGADGMLHVPADGPVVHATLGRSLRGNTTGAGDAAVAAIAAAAASGVTDPATILRTAVAWSAAAVLHPLAGSITDPEPLLSEVVVTTES